MSRKILFVTIAAGIIILLSISNAEACTNLLVTKGASEDGSVMITYTCDDEFHPQMAHQSAAIRLSSRTGTATCAAISNRSSIPTPLWR
jgi:dipeptidase